MRIVMCNNLHLSILILCVPFLETWIGEAKLNVFANHLVCLSRNK